MNKINNQMNAALWMEIQKLRKAKIFPATIYFFAFIGIMMGFILYLTMHPEIAGRSATMQMKTSFISIVNWNAYYELLMQVAVTIMVIGSGVISSWVFGREFSDRTVKDLLALPVSRSSIVYSKLIVLLFWSLLLSLVILIAAMLTGFVIKIPDWNPEAFWPFFENYFLAAFMNILLITPVALVASAGRGYILPISYVILTMIFSQLLIVGLPSISYWIPWLLPAVLSGVAKSLSPTPGFMSYLLYAIVVIGSLAGTIIWWNRADQK